MANSLDRNFIIQAECREHGHRHTDEDAVLFLAKDVGLVPTLRFYLEFCGRVGAGKRQLEGIHLLIERVDKWQREHPELLKVADIDEGIIGDSIIAPNI